MSRLNKYFSQENVSLESAKPTNEGKTNLVEVVCLEELDLQESELALEALDIEEVEQDIVSLESIVVSLESVAAIAEAAKEDGGLDRHGAALLANRVDAITASLEMEESIIPSVESFGGTGERLSSTSVSVESIKETAKKVVNAVVAALKNAYEIVKKWVAKFFLGAESLGKKAEAMRGKAASLKDVTVKEAEIKIDGPAKQLHIDGKVEDVEKLVKASVDASKELLVKPFTETTKVAKSLADSAVEAAKGKLEEKDIVEAAQMLTLPTMDAVGSGKEMSDELPGGKVIKQSKDKEGFDYTVSFEDAKEKVELKDVKVKTLEPMEVVKVAQAVETLAKSLGDFKGQMDDATKAKDETLKSVQAAGLIMEKGENVELAKKGMQLSKLANRMLDKPYLPLAGQLLSTGKAALDVCNASLKQYETKKEEAA